MPSATTKLQVWNLAIDLIRDTALQTVEDNSPTARWMARNYDHAVLTTLRSYPWNFAKELVALSADVGKPAHSWVYAYKPPPGWVRVLPIRRNGDRFGVLVPHEIVGNRILTNEAPPLKCTLIMDKTANPGEWDSLFVEIVRCKLALGMANKFSSKNKFIELSSQLLAAAIQQAETMDAYEGSPEPIETFDILRARGGDEYSLTVRRG